MTRHAGAAGTAGSRTMGGCATARQQAHSCYIKRHTLCIFVKDSRLSYFAADDVIRDRWTGVYACRQKNLTCTA
eukprot:scaffold381757_cov15-Prasinocladus_malaysianus.AAC.1